MTTTARLAKAVTFNHHRRSEFTLAAGSVVEAQLITGTDFVIVTFAGHRAVISMDDASPVTWDDVEEMWIED